MRIVSVLRKLRRRVYELLEREVPGNIAAVAVHRVLIVLILSNVAGSVLDTVPWINAAYDPLFDQFETFSLIVFAAEYLVRFWAARENPLYKGGSPFKARLVWASSAAGLIDLLAVAPFLVSLVLDIDLRVLVLLRLLRFFKIARYSPGFRSLIDAVRTQRHALGACLIIISAVILISAGVMYAIEHDAQPDKFSSIPDAMWWAAATVTTVGYGDVVPVTTLGRIVGGFTMVTGLLMLALPAGIVATSFAGIITRQHFVVTAGMVARMPLFNGIDATAIIDLLPAISTRSFNRGAYILHRAQTVGALYLVTEGEVEIMTNGNRVRVGTRGAFGGEPQRPEITARAMTRVRLLVVEENDFALLCGDFPILRRRIRRLNRLAAAPRADLVNPPRTA